LEPKDFNVWSDKWMKLRPEVKNDVLFCFRPIRIAHDFFNAFAVMGVIFPKVFLRVYHDVSEFLPIVTQDILTICNYVPTVFCSDFHRDDFRKHMMKFGIRPRSESLHSLYTQVDDLKINSFADNRGKKIIFHAPYVYCSDTKRHELAQELFNIAAIGRDSEFFMNLYLGQGMINDKRIKDLLETKDEKLKINIDPPREKYFDELKQHHVFIFCSKKETGNVTFLEMLCAGMVGLFYRFDGYKEIVGSDYPFVADDRAKAVVMLRWIMDNYEEAQRKVQPFREKLIAGYGVKAWENKWRVLINNFFVKQVEREVSE
jgi:hypothetical protein